MSANAFLPMGKTVAHTGTVSGSLPTPVQVPTTSGSGMAAETFVFWNSGANPCWLAYAQASADATANAVVPVTGTSQQVIALPPASVQSFRIPGNPFFCGITTVGTSVIYITPGEGV